MKYSVLVLYGDVV